MELVYNHETGSARRRRVVLTKEEEEEGRKKGEGRRGNCSTIAQPFLSFFFYGLVVLTV
jgi:hypothetical protein